MSKDVDSWNDARELNCFRQREKLVQDLMRELLDTERFVGRTEYLRYCAHQVLDFKVKP